VRRGGNAIGVEFRAAIAGDELLPTRGSRTGAARSDADHRRGRITFQKHFREEAA